MKKSALFAGLAVGALMSCPTSFAYAQTVNANQVDEVIVTASRTAERLKDVPASVSVVSAAQIKDTPAQGLDDTLRLVPGVNLTMIGPDVGHPTAYNEGMRGLPTTETRFLVLMDGAPVNDPFFGYIQWNRIPLDNIDRVEIVRGGGSPLWGDTAMGGVVNVITRAPTRNELDVDAAGGSYGSYRTSAYGAYRVSDQFALSLNTAFSGTAGYQTTPASWTSYGSTTVRSPVYAPTSFNARNVGARADFAPTSDLTGFFVFNYHSNDQVLSTPIGLDNQQTFTYSGQVKKTFGNGGALAATAFHDDSHFVTNNPHILPDFTTEYNSNVHTTPVTDTGGSLTWSQDLPTILKSYSFGVDVHEISGNDYANYYLPSGALAVPTIVGGGKQLFVGGFAQVRLEPIKRLEIVGSLRYQYYRSYDGIDTFPPAIGAIPASSKTSTDPRVNVRYAFNDSFALRGAYYQSFRAPTLDQLYRTYADTTAGIYEGNPFLKPETLEGGEVGLDFNRPGFRSQLTFYSTTITNLITQRNLVSSEYPTTLGVVCGYDASTYAYLTCTRNINAASAVARGIELEADWDLGRGVTAGFAYTYTDSHYTSNPEDPTAVGERLEGVPMHNVSGHVAYQAPAGWRIATDLRWVSKSYGDAHPDDGLIQNAHFVMDVSASYPLTHYLQAYVQIQNLTDSRYIAQNGGGAPILGTPFEGDGRLSAAASVRPAMNGSALYAAVWRWHFIAGLLVLPVLVMMAITGGAYLFQPELDHLAYRKLEDIPARAEPMAPPSAVIPKVETALHGRVLLITPPARPDRSVRLLVRVSSGETLTAFADPYDGHFIGATPFGGIMQLVRKIHSLQKFGFWASCLIEITAGWAIVLVGTGVFLWWPRGKIQGGVVSVRGSPSRRLFWRDLHAVTGVFAAAVILFLAVTGMPWSMFWGAHVQQWATAANLYEPPPPAQVTPDWQMSATMPNMPHAPHGADPAVRAQMPWAMETMSMPMSQPMPGMRPIGVDRAAAIFRTLGLPPATSLSLPDGPNGAYVATLRPDRVEDTRVVYLDQYAGKVLGDVGFKDWGPAAKAIEWGVAVHQGQEYGPLNRYLMLAGCVCVVLLAVTSITMWWKRRPKGSLGIPPPPVEPRAMRGLVVIVVIVGIIYPLVGATLVLAFVIDRFRACFRSAAVA